MTSFFYQLIIEVKVIEYNGRRFNLLTQKQKTTPIRQWRTGVVFIKSQYRSDDYELIHSALTAPAAFQHYPNLTDMKVLSDVQVFL